MTLSLLDLPNELLLHLGDMLPNDTLNRLILTNRRLADLLNPMLWHFTNFQEDEDDYQEEDDAIGFGLGFGLNFDVPALSNTRVNSPLDILTYAVRADNTAVLHKLSQNCDLDYTTWGTAIDQAFSEAITQGNSSWVGILLDMLEGQHQRLNPQTLDLGLRTSVERKDMPMAERLLRHGPIALSLWDIACHRAVQFHNQDLFGLILDVGQPDPAPTTMEINRLFHGAALCRNIPAMDALLERGAELDAFSQTLDIHSPNEPPLHAAARANAVDVVSWLLTHGADVNSIGYNDRTAANWAAGRPKILQLLVSHGADLHHRDRRGNTPLVDAARSKSSKGFRYLLSQLGGFKPGFTFQPDDLAGFRYALEYGMSCAETVGLILDRVDLKKEGEQLLICAACPCNILVLKEFIARGVSLNSRSPEGKTLLHIYASWRVPMDDPLLAAAKFVLDTYPESLTEVDGEGNSPLHWAVKGVHRPMVQLLLGRGASPVSRNQKGETPISIARELGEIGYTEVFNWLEPFTAPPPPPPTGRESRWDHQE